MYRFVVSCHFIPSKHNILLYTKEEGKKPTVDFKYKGEIFPKYPQSKYISSLSGLLVSNLKCVSRFG